MSIFVDKKFLKLLSPKLSRFSQKKEDLFNFRCPFCGDSQKNKLKARGYIYRKKNDYFYKCQNCGIGHNMFNFVNLIDTDLSKEYTLEKFREKSNNKVEFTALTEKPQFVTVQNKLNLPKICDLSPEHFAYQYCDSRKIPKENFSELFYANDFKKFVDEIKPEHGKDLKEDDPRLVIPFLNEKNELIAFQGRALRDSKLRYITIKLGEDNIKYFGINKVDTNENIYVTEGPIDSLFLPNCIATADSNLMRVSSYFAKEKLTLIFDNEPRNKDICKLIDDAIDNHFKVCIWPEMVEEKDINDMILAGYTKEEVMDIIEKNTFVNLRAKIEFINWRKV